MVSSPSGFYGSFASRRSSRMFESGSTGATEAISAGAIAQLFLEQSEEFYRQRTALLPPPGRSDLPAGCAVLNALYGHPFYPSSQLGLGYNSDSQPRRDQAQNRRVFIRLLNNSRMESVPRAELNDVFVQTE